MVQVERVSGLQKIESRTSNEALAKAVSRPNLKLSLFPVKYFLYLGPFFDKTILIQDYFPRSKEETSNIYLRCLDLSPFFMTGLLHTGLFPSPRALIYFVF